MKPEAIDIAVSFDTTGSMYPALAEVRRKVRELVEWAFKTIPNLHFSILTHGDYCDGRDVLTMLDFTDDSNRIADFVATAPKTGGGDAPECYELVLNRARQLKWRSGKSKVLILIGDDVPHGPSYPQNKEHLDWRNELGLLLEAGIHVYAVQALARSHATHFYKEVAQKTGGFHLELHQFSAINDLIMAICLKQDSTEALLTFEKKVQEEGRMTDVVGAAFDLMVGRPVREVRSTSRSWSKSSSAKSFIKAKADVDVSKLEPVHPSRFQVLDVESACDIKGFVLDRGLSFKKGRGFYEFRKAVEVQPYKEVVLVDNVSGAMFGGNEARIMLGLPPTGEGKNINLHYTPIPGFTAFIQSTSVNRKLLGGTKFLYEVEDWDSASI